MKFLLPIRLLSTYLLNCYDYSRSNLGQNQFRKLLSIVYISENTGNCVRISNFNDTIDGFNLPRSSCNSETLGGKTYTTNEIKSELRNYYKSLKYVYSRFNSCSNMIQSITVIENSLYPLFDSFYVGCLGLNTGTKSYYSCKDSSQSNYNEVITKFFIVDSVTSYMNQSLKFMIQENRNKFSNQSIYGYSTQALDNLRVVNQNELSLLNSPQGLAANFARGKQQTCFNDILANNQTLRILFMKNTNNLSLLEHNGFSTVQERTELKETITSSINCSYSTTQTSSTLNKCPSNFPTFKATP